MLDRLNNTFPKRPDFIYRILFFIFLLVGAVLRLREYLANDSLFLDEAFLALNVIHKSPWQLISQPLNYNQSAPIGFLLTTKLFITLLGTNEYALRLFPFVAGTLSLGLFFKLLTKYTDKITSLIATLLFSIGALPVSYSAIFKPYSSDVFFALLLLLSFLPFVSEELSGKKAILLTLAGLISLCFSTPAVFMLAAGFAALLFIFYSGKRNKEMMRLLVSASLCGIGFFLICLLSLRHVSSNLNLEQVWSQYFLPLTPNLIKILDWISKYYIRIIYTPTGIYKPLWGFAAFLVGAYSFAQKKKEFLYICLLPIVFALIASAIHKYPFGRRLMLFSVPVILIMIAEGISFLFKASSFKKVICYLLVIMVLSPSITAVIQHVYQRNSYFEEDIKPVLEYTSIKIRHGDLIYLYSGAQPTFDYYAQRYGLNDFSVIKGISSKKNWTNYKKDLAQLKGNKRVWVIFCHLLNEDEKFYMLGLLNKWGKILDGKEALGAGTYLFDLSKS